jgi:hypothetical protein
MIHADYVEQGGDFGASVISTLVKQWGHLRASEASSASLNLPGKNQLIERSEDSRVDIFETLLTRKDSY